MITGISNAITRIWELDEDSKTKLFKPTAYRRTYVLPFRWTDVFNRQPQSFNPERPIPEFKDYQNVEVKFQLSMKVKIMEGVLFGKGNLWLGFTQSAYWQMYNGGLSRPFREINYEPELILTYPIDLSLGDFKVRMAGLSVNHQSNGKEQSLSRSWNRIIFMSAYEYGNWGLLHRVWYRLPENPLEDDNPKISGYMGKTDAHLFYNSHRHIFSLYMRSNLGDPFRGFVEFSYIYPIKGDLKLLFQASHGYGDSLIEYNHKQTTLGVGIIFLDF